MLPRFLAALLLLALILPCRAQVTEVKPLRPMHRIGTSQFIEGPDGNLYTLESPYGAQPCLLSMSRDGKSLRRLPLPPELVPWAFTFGEDGDLYGTTRHAVVRISRSGTTRILHTFALGPDEDYIVEPGPIFRAPDGTIHGATYRRGAAGKGSVFRIHRDGTVDEFSPSTEPGIVGPTSLVLGHDGATWGTASSGWFNHATVFRMASDGSFTNPVANLALNECHQVFAHPDGNYYAFEHAPLHSGYFNLVRITPGGTATRLAKLFLGNMIFSARIVLGRDGHFYIGQGDTVARVSAAGEIAHLPFQLPRGSTRTNNLMLAHDGFFYGMFETVPNGLLSFRIKIGEQGPLNLPPIARDDFATQPAPGETRVIPVLANDTDANRDALSLTTVNAPALGNAEIDSTGRKIIYTAPLGEPLFADELTYEVSDGAGGTATGRVSLRRVVRGTFSELLQNPDPKHDGYIQVTLAGRGRFTGALWLGGLRFPILGTLDLLGGAHVPLPGPGAPRLQLTVAIAAGRPIIDANLEYDGVLTPLNLSAPNDDAGRPAAGAYTWIIPPRPEWLQEPARFPREDGGTALNPLYQAAGYGAGTMIILPNGRVRLAGHLPNGRPIAAANALDASGNLAFFAGYHRSRFHATGRGVGGWIRGKVLLRDRASVSDADGTLVWRMPPPFYRPSYVEPLNETPLSFLASRYSASSSLTQALGTTSTPQFTATRGDLRLPATASLSISGLQFRATAGANSASAIPLSLDGNLTSSSGLLRGTFGPSTWSISTPFRGVIFQKQDTAFGQFDSLTVERGTGAFRIAP